jgi:hypothetical protein
MALKGKRKFKNSEYVVVPVAGIPCPRCGRPTQIREHARIGEKHLKQPYYFSRWFYCRHRDCRTKLIMREQFKVCSRHVEKSRGVAVSVTPPDRGRTF